MPGALAGGLPTVLVAGCGVLGRTVVAGLRTAGVRFAVIDRDATAFAAMPREVAAVGCVGDATDPAVLGRAGAASARCLVVATPRDVTSLTVAMTCRTAFRTAWVVARACDPSRLDTFRILDVTPVCPAALGVAELLRRVADRASLVGRGTMKSLYVVVIGCGRLGANLANQLSRAGHRVVVVDRNESAFAGLAAGSFSGFRVEGDASQPGVLRQAKIEQADVLVAATREDNVNLMVALVAKRIFGVKNVMARVYDPKREEIYRALDLETVCPTLIAGEAFLRLVNRAQESGEVES